jgi:hypothetical protein
MEKRIALGGAAARRSWSLARAGSIGARQVSFVRESSKVGFRPETRRASAIFGPSGTAFG